MLKEYIKKDHNVYMNSKEFSETVTVNSVSVNVVIDNDRLTQKIVKEYDGLVIGDILFYITAEEYAKIPHMGKTPKADVALVFNNKPCIITSVTANMGIYEVVLQYSGGGR